jgi:dihydrofolate reductase
MFFHKDSKFVAIQIGSLLHKTTFMRKLILKMQMSLDGFVIGVNGDMSWMQPDDDEQWDDLFEMLQDVDLFVLGSGMWEEYRDYWKKALGEPGFSANEIKYAQLAEKTKHIVFSGRLKDAGWENTSINSGSLVDEIKKLKQQQGKSIQIVGGAKFAASLIDSGLVDEYHLIINPAIIAGGKSFFHELNNRQSLELMDVKRMSKQLVVVIYKQLTSESKNNHQPLKRRPDNNPHSEKG